MLGRIATRAIDYEQSIESTYLEALGRAYGRFFGDYRAAPVVIIDTSTLNFAAGGRAVDGLLTALLKPATGGTSTTLTVCMEARLRQALEWG